MLLEQASVAADHFLCFARVLTRAPELQDVKLELRAPKFGRSDCAATPASRALATSYNSSLYASLLSGKTMRAGGLDAAEHESLDSGSCVRPRGTEASALASVSDDFNRPAGKAKVPLQAQGVHLTVQAGRMRLFVV